MSDKIGKLMSENRWCYFIPPQDGDNGFIPAMVIENQPGYRMMSGNGKGSAPWYWGKTEDKANEVCDEVNKNHGINPKDKIQIVLSSMPGNFAKRKAA